MLAGGAVGEVEQALERGASRTARKALGFKEIAAHLAGEATLEEVRERIERGHRAYVRRQLTWMRKLAGVRLIDRTGMSAREAAERILV
jgi:tRNA dimethylallyltransferase